MKINGVRMAKNTLAFVLAVELSTMQFFIPPYVAENEFEFFTEFNDENKNINKRTLKKTNANSYYYGYQRQARNSLKKPNY